MVYKYFRGKNMRVDLDIISKQNSIKYLTYVRAIICSEEPDFTVRPLYGMKVLQELRRVISRGVKKKWTPIVNRGRRGGKFE